MDSDFRVGGHQSDSAHALVAGHSEVTSFTPCGRPRVLDDPVVHAGDFISTVADDEDSMVKGCGGVATLGFGVDTVGVELEGTVAGIDGDRNWAIASNGFSQSFFITRWQIDVVAQFSVDFSVSAETAPASVTAFKWVTIFSVNATLFNVTESIVHKTTIATVVAKVFGAINQVLFRKAAKSVSFHEILAFQSTLIF